jgi:pimeloyl-ACP methyl ester carboxylesterase
MELLHSKILGEGKALVILHGLFGMLDNWQGLGRKFAEEYQVHLIDQRNHGHSFHAEGHNYDLMAADLEHYIQHHQLEKIILMGHSMGGKTAMLFASLHPDIVEQLIVVDIAPKYYPPHHQAILAGLNDVASQAISSRKEADTILASHFPEMSMRQFLLKNLHRKDKDQLVFRFNLEAIQNDIEQIGEALPDPAIFHKPTLFVKGEKSNYILDKDEELIETHFPDATIVSIRNAGHWVHAENPVDFYQSIEEFLRWA